MKVGAALLMLLPAAAEAAEPASCLDLSRVRGPEITRDGAILYHQSGKLSWRAETIGRCPGLRRESRLIVYAFAGDRICRGDRFQPVEPQSPVAGANCRFAGFVPLDTTSAR